MSLAPIRIHFSRCSCGARTTCLGLLLVIGVGGCSNRSLEIPFGYPRPAVGSAPATGNVAAPVRDAGVPHAPPAEDAGAPDFNQAPTVVDASAPNLNRAPPVVDAGSPDVGRVMDLADADQGAPPTLHFQITSVSAPLGAPGDATLDGETAVFTAPTASNHIDIIDYEVSGFSGPGSYDLWIDWVDKANQNQGWVASVEAYNVYGGTHAVINTAAPENGGVTITLQSAGAVAQNTLTITLRSKTAPTTDYGIWQQVVRPR